MDFAQLTVAHKRLRHKHEKLWRLFTELHTEWRSLTPDGKNSYFGEVEVLAIDVKSQSFQVAYLGLRIQVRYIYSPWLEDAADRGAATVRYSLLDPCNPTNTPMVAGHFTYRTDGIATVSDYETDQLDLDEPNTAFQLLGLMLLAAVHLER